MKRTGRDRKRRRNDRGMSFVEVIVSMLILSIAVLALLSGFTMSLNINMKSRRSMYATIVAQNVMECVKEYSRFYVVKSSVSDTMKDFLPASYVGTSNFTSLPDGFSLSSVSEGPQGSNFKVTVSYNEGDFTEINDRQLPNLSTIDSDHTEILYLSGAAEESIQKAAKDYFYDLWYADQLTYDYDGSPIEPSAEDIEKEKKKIEKEMTAKLTIALEKAAFADKYTGTVIVKYYRKNKEYPYFSDEHSFTFEKPATGEKPNLYLLYQPVGVELSGETAANILDEIYVKNTFLEWNLFLAIQETGAGLAGRQISGPSLEKTVDSTSSKVYVYSNSQLYSSGIFECNGKHPLFFRKDGYERLQEVTVTVTDKTTGETLAELKSTVSQQK